MKRQKEGHSKEEGIVCVKMEAGSSVWQAVGFEKIMAKGK